MGNKFRRLRSQPRTSATNTDTHEFQGKEINDLQNLWRGVGILTRGIKLS